jgi:hypothetical protein
MKCQEFKELCGALALGALEPDEQKAALSHLARDIEHEGCEEELLRAQRVVVALGAAAPAAAPEEEEAGRASSWDEVTAAIEAQKRGPGRALAAAETRRDAGPRAKVVRGRAPARESAAFALAIASAILLYVTVDKKRAVEDRLDRAQVELSDLRRAALQRDACRELLGDLQKRSRADERVVAMLAEPGAAVFEVVPLEGKPLAARGIVGEAGARIILVSTHPAQPGTDFQLWVLRGDDAPKPAGFLRPSESGLLVGEIDPALLAAGEIDAVAVSREPTGGRPTPTEVLAVGKPRT